jgi:hypothetical protein
VGDSVEYEVSFRLQEAQHLADREGRTARAMATTGTLVLELLAVTDTGLQVLATARLSSKDGREASKQWILEAGARPGRSTFEARVEAAESESATCPAAGKTWSCQRRSVNRMAHDGPAVSLSTSEESPLYLMGGLLSFSEGSSGMGGWRSSESWTLTRATVGGAKTAAAVSGAETVTLTRYRVMDAWLVEAVTGLASGLNAESKN